MKKLNILFCALFLSAVFALPAIADDGEVGQGNRLEYRCLTGVNCSVCDPAAYNCPGGTSSRMAASGSSSTSETAVLYAKPEPAGFFAALLNYILG